MITSEVKNPHVGMLAIVRKRRAVISEVRPFLGEDSVLHLVRMEYKDDASPEFEELIWEREPHRQLLEPNALPQGSDPPMVADDFDVSVRLRELGADTRLEGFSSPLCPGGQYGTSIRPEVDRPVATASREPTT